MNPRLWWQIVAAVFVGVLSALVVRYIFVRAAGVFMLFGVGLLVAWIMDPLLDGLERHRWPRWAAAWAVTLGFLIVVSLTALLIIPQLVAQAQDAAAHWQEYSQKADALYQSWRAQLENYALEHWPDIEVMPFVDAKVQQARQWIEGHLPQALQWISQQLLASLNLVLLFVLLLLISFHFMMIIDPLRKQIRALLTPAVDTDLETLEWQISTMLGQYLRGLFVVCFLVGLSAAFLIWIHSLYFGTKYSLVLGLITGLTYPIPYIGPAISAVSAGFIGLVTAQSGPLWLSAVTAMGAMAAINQCFDWIITPRIVGQRVGLHPLLVLFSVMLGYSLLGIIGMIIATPAAACLKIFLTRWLPIKTSDASVPRPKRKLEIDLFASAQLIVRKLVKSGEEKEHILFEEVLGKEKEAAALPVEADKPWQAADTEPEQETKPSA